CAAIHLLVWMSCDKPLPVILVWIKEILLLEMVEMRCLRVELWVFLIQKRGLFLRKSRTAFIPFIAMFSNFLTNLQPFMTVSQFMLRILMVHNEECSSTIRMLEQAFILL